MAELVLGIGTSHGPLLSTPPDKWGLRAVDDRKNPRHYFKNRTWSFDELLKARGADTFTGEITPEARQRHYDACQAAIATLGDVFAETRPDVAVIFGDDQMEMFTEASIPAFSVFWGETIDHAPPDAEHVAKMPPGITIAIPGHAPPQATAYRGVPELGRHIIEGLIADAFDVAAMKTIPAGHHGHPSAPHAYGFLYRQIMRDRVVPNVPVVLNTFYPPNQPTVRRCYDFGRSVVRAIRSWKSDARVALIASCGLTHFVIDEEVDQIILEAMRTNDIDRLAALGEATFQAGTSEVKNWIPVFGAMSDLGYKMTLVDYVPCYRSEAGTGNAMGFVHWRP